MKKGTKLTPEEAKIRRDRLAGFRELAFAKMRQQKEFKVEKVAHYIAMNPFAGSKDICRGCNLPYTAPWRKVIADCLAQPAMKDKILAYKQEFVNPQVMADLQERYRTLAMQAVEKAQERLMAKDCKDATLVEVLRVCGQYLAPKNAAVQINAGQGSLVGILSDLQSSAQESLAKLPINGEAVIKEHDAGLKLLNEP